MCLESKYGKHASIFATLSVRIQNFQALQLYILLGKKRSPGLSPLMQIDCEQWPQNELLMAQQKLLLHSHSYIFYGNLRQSRLLRRISYIFPVRIHKKFSHSESWHANNIKQEEGFLCLWIVYVCCISLSQKKKISPFFAHKIWRLGESQVKILARILLVFSSLTLPRQS